MSCFLSNSSLGKKLVMSVTGCFLVLFILFHMSMNIVAIISPEAYNMICALLGANWYALAGTAVLAAGVVVHFIYAVILTLENLKARGNQRYAVTVVEPGVSWASKNMLVLGFIILGGLALHLFNFWAKMQLVEVLGGHENSLGLHPADGASLIAYTFSQWYYVVIYVVSPPEVHRQHRGDGHLPRLRRRRGDLLHQECLPLLRRRLLTDYPEQ